MKKVENITIQRSELANWRNGELANWRIGELAPFNSASLPCMSQTGEPKLPSISTLVSGKPQQPQHISLIGEFHCVDVFGSAAAEFVEVGFVPRK